MLDVREEPGRPLLQTLCAHLKTRRVLLILDNCEHLIKAVGRPRAAPSCARRPSVRILASSREPLRVPGEQTYPVLPLPVPAQRRRPRRAGALDRRCASSSSARSCTSRPSRSTEREAPAVAELVARLEGIPLALELAAARVHSLTVADINARLKDRYKLLTGGARVLQERQQTLRALVDWSYDLLEPKRADRCSTGSASSSAASTSPRPRRSAAPSRSSRDDVLDLLGSLVEKSLVMLEERDDGTRYQMLETIRDYAREKLAQRGDVPAARRRSTATTTSRWPRRRTRGLSGPEQADWLCGSRSSSTTSAARSRSRWRAASIRSSRSSSRWRCRASGSCAATRPKVASSCGRARAAGGPGLADRARPSRSMSAPRSP